MLHPASLALSLTPLIALVVAGQTGLRVRQESLPAKVVQLFTTADEVDDNRDEIEEANEEDGKQSMTIGQEGKRSYGVNVPGAVIMRSLKRSSSSEIPSRTVRLGVQEHAMLRSLRSSGRPLGISQESLMRSLRSAETPDSKRSYKINLAENAMMRSLRSDDEETGMLRSLRSCKTGAADQAVMRSLRSSSNPNIVDAAMLRSLRSQDLNVARDALLRSLRQDTDINQQAMMRSLRSSSQPNNINGAAMMRPLRSYKPSIANDAMMRSLRSYKTNIKDESMMRSLRSFPPTSRLVTRDPHNEGIMRSL